MTTANAPVPLDFSVLNKLEATFGSSFYLADPSLFCANVDDFLSTFRAIYANTYFGYPYKCNYIPHFCKLADSKHLYAEVASRMELELALKLGVLPDRIIFNGPYKTDDDILTAIRAGILLNLDSLGEVRRFLQIFNQNSIPRPRVGLRCNFSAPSIPRSRFGIDTENGDLDEAAELLLSSGITHLNSLHCHFVTKNRSVSDYAAIADRMISLFDALSPRFTIASINLGGGFFSPMPTRMAQQFGTDIPSYADYGTAIAKHVAARFRSDPRPELIIEPGMAVIADVMRFVCKVTDIKRIGDRLIAQTTGSVYNIKPSKSRTHLPIYVVAPTENDVDTSLAQYDIAGYTCMEDDYLDRGFSHRISRGDYLVFENVGAYSVVLKPPFISPMPPVIVLDKSPDSRPAVLKRAETLSDIFASYNIQDR